MQGNVFAEDEARNYYQPIVALFLRAPHFRNQEFQIVVGHDIIYSFREVDFLFVRVVLLVYTNLLVDLVADEVLLVDCLVLLGELLEHCRLYLIPVLVVD